MTNAYFYVHVTRRIGLVDEMVKRRRWAEELL
jgi:hypothetical protein